MPPPMIAIGAAGMSGFQREQTDQRFRTQRRRFVGQRLFGSARQRPHDLGGDVIDELSIGLAETGELLLEPRELRATNGVEAIVKGPAGGWSAHDADGGKSSAVAIAPVGLRPTTVLPDSRQPSIIHSGGVARESPRRPRLRRPGPRSRDTAALPIPRRAP